MAAPSAPTGSTPAPRFAPGERPRAAIATDGTLAAIIESQRVVVLELPGGEPFAEVGVDPAASANEVAWVGAPPRLLVLSRYAEHTRVHLVDPHGPRALADLRLETPMRLAATCGAHALVVSPQSALIITAADDILVSIPYPSRAVPAHAGVAGTNFLVAHADSVEEWDPNARMPKRRLKLPRAATITALGGSDRVVWMTTQQEPSRLDVLALVDRGQPKAHDLPEPITFATGHPRSDLVVCLGASGRMYVVDLDGRSKLKTLAVNGIDNVQAAALVVGRLVGVLAAQAERPIVIVTLDGQTPDPEVATPAPIAPAASGASRSGSTMSAPVVSRTMTPTGSGPSGPASGAVSSAASGAGSGGASGAVSASSGAASSAVSGSSGTTGSVTSLADVPVERKKPPPPPPGRTGNTVPPPLRQTGSTGTVPPPMTGSTHATGSAVVPTSSSTSATSSSTSATPSSTSATPSSTSATSTPTGATSTGGSSTSAGLSLPAVAPGSSSLARPATRAFARAPTPHPRATSEGVEVDLEGVFDELSAEAAAYNDRAPSPASSEQFDSPLAFEARPVADHLEPADRGKSPPRMTDPRPVPSASDRPKRAKTEPKVDAKPEKTRAKTEPKADSKSDSKSDAKPDAKTDAKADTRADAKADTRADAKADRADGKADRADGKADTRADARPASKPAERPGQPATAKSVESAKAEKSDDARSIERPDTSIETSADDSDDDEDLAPPTLVRDEADTLVRDSNRNVAVVREAVAKRESGLSLRDAPVRKARREVTLRQAPPLPVTKPAWRDEIVFWTYEVFDGVVQRGAPIASPLDDLAGRFSVPDTILPALVVLYGAHLAGERGVAPVHVARVLGSWDEALGRGLLAGRGLATFLESRVRLAGPIQRFLDEVPVETGALVGMPGEISLPGPHAVIAKAETPLKMVAVRWLAAVGGAILAAHDDADLGELFVEARARGAAPMFRLADDDLMELGTDPAILVVTDEEVAESLGVPRLG